MLLTPKEIRMGYQGTYQFEHDGHAYVDAWTAEPNPMGDGYWLWIDVRTERNHDAIVAGTRALVEVAYNQATPGNEERLRDELNAAAAALAGIPQHREPRMLLADLESIVEHFVRRRGEASRAHMEWALNLPT
jgi:hypothetical protein